MSIVCCKYHNFESERFTIEYEHYICANSAAFFSNKNNCCDPILTDVRLTLACNWDIDGDT